jgi:D-lactate dehydrogenase
MKIHVFETEGWERDPFAALADEHELSFFHTPLTPDNAAEHAEAEAITTFIYSSLGADVLDALPALRAVASRSTGVDHIDLERCRERGIMVCNVPTYGANTVAEHVFGLLLMISHRLEEAVQRTRSGRFDSHGLQGFDLKGKRMGVVGTGDIGLETIRIARGFGMDVLGFDVAPDADAAERLGFEYVSLDELLARADVISLHVPETPQTHHLIDRPQFERMKPGAVLINTARGGLVNTQALARALAEKQIAAAGLDVLPEEPTIREEAELLRSVYEQHHHLEHLLANEVLAHLRNVIITPHSAFNTREAVARILDTTVENLRACAAGAPQNVVT